MRSLKVRRIFIFLFLTFTLSWGFDFILISAAGSHGYSGSGMNPWGMLVPAFVALSLQIFFYKDSHIYYRIYTDKPRWIFFSFMVLTIIYGILRFTAALHTGYGPIFQGLGALLFTLWTLFVFFIAGQSDKTSLERAGLKLTNIPAGQRFIVGIVLFFLLQSAFNLLLGLGEFAGKADHIYGVPVPSFLYIPSIILFFLFVTVIGIPLSGLAGIFGEEYGWRGYLLSESIPAGKLRAVIFIGFIWGMWHIPVILRGIHTYPPSLTGIVLGIVFFILWGVIQGYAVLKTGSIWIAAFMHGVVNSVYSFSLTYISKPDNNVFAFGLGVYGLICLGLIVCFILKDPVWKTDSGRHKND